jgi:hypothetical protein
VWEMMVLIRVGCRATRTPGSIADTTEQEIRLSGFLEHYALWNRVCIHAKPMRTVAQVSARFDDFRCTA